MSVSISSSDTNFICKKEDPKTLLALVDNYVKVHVIKNHSYVGFVHSIDPLTHSIILSIPQEDRYQTTIIPGHAILDVTKEEKSGEPPPRKPVHTESKEDLLKRKKLLIAWFKSNLLPVTELDDKIIIGNASLLPPYDNLNLYTENPIVALEIRKVMERMPGDFNT